MIKPVGAPSKGDDKREPLKTPFSVKRKLINKYGLKYWREYLRDCIKAKETELESK